MQKSQPPHDDRSTSSRAGTPERRREAPASRESRSALPRHRRRCLGTNSSVSRQSELCTGTTTKQVSARETSAPCPCQTEERALSGSDRPRCTTSPRVLAAPHVLA
jgi:hypothetical protein